MVVHIGVEGLSHQDLVLSFTSVVGSGPKKTALSVEMQSIYTARLTQNLVELNKKCHLSERILPQVEVGGL